MKKIFIQQNVRKGGTAGPFSRYGRGTKKPRTPKKGRVKRFLSWAAIIALALFFAGSIAFIGMIAWFSRDLPDPDKISLRILAQTTKIYDRTGEVVLFEVHGDQKRTVVKLDAISDYAKWATISAEDRDFYSHKGFDIKGLLRSIFRNVTTGSRVGGSTITQQFIKNSVLSPEKTYTRKIKELVLSLEIERRFTKDQILKLYLNEIPYGSVIYGIESAAETYFGKTAKDLSISESAVLASIPKATTYYSPYGSNRDELMARAHFIIDAMAEEGYVTVEEAEEAKADDVLERVLPHRGIIIAPHFVFYVKEFLAEEFGEQRMERGGLKVITTLDADMQAFAEETIEENIERIHNFGGSTAALLALNPSNGEVLAMVGSADYFNDDINGKFNAITGKLQPGSSIKPMVYAAGFEKGYTPGTVLYDVVTRFQDQPRYEPRNYDLKERGPMTVRESLAGSLNIPAVKMLYLTGMNTFFRFAERLGYTTFADRSSFGLSLVLGGGEVIPLEHIAAFSAFAQDGVVRPIKAVLRVEDIDGNVLLDAEDRGKGKRVMDKEVARQITDILSDNAARAFTFGENNYLTLGERPVGTKTGTTNDYKDSWTIGYTPSLVAGVWAGNADGSRMYDGASGSSVAAPIWNGFMRKALANTVIERFKGPLPIITGKPVLDGTRDAQVKVDIDTISGKLATEFTPEEYIEEKGFGVPHSILFFIDKDDPRGPQPERPEDDFQFQKWEDAILRWATEQEITMSPPPTEYDDVHTPENIPKVIIRSPEDNKIVDERIVGITLDVEVRRSIGKVEYLIDDEIIITRDRSPFWGSITIPNRFPKGFHTLSARVYDDVGNNAIAYVTINLTAKPGPIGVQWVTPWVYQNIYRSSQFPFIVKFTIDDPKSIKRLSLYAEPQDGSDRIDIGSISYPAFQNMSMQWKGDDVHSTLYDLTIEVTLQSGDIRKESITVYVR